MRAPPVGGVLAIAAALAAVFIARRIADPTPRFDYADPWAGDGAADAPPWPEATYPAETPAAPAGDPLAAFLWVIRNAEHKRRDVVSGADYFTTYGGRAFSDSSDHPTLTGEWMGAPLSNAMCRAAGYRVGCKSTAAGAYQITRPTWDDVRKAGTWGPALVDFGPASQDEAARRILILCGALNSLQLGDFEGAVSKASTRWASLPGSTAGQGGRSFAQVQSFFNEGLGVA